MNTLPTSFVSEIEATAVPMARLERFFEAAKCRTQVELATFLGIQQSSISDAKKRRVIPPDWLLTLLCKKWINPQWILTGEGPRHLHPCENGVPVTLPAQTIVERRPPQECSIDELIREVVRRAMSVEESQSRANVLRRSRRPVLRRPALRHGSPARRTVRL